MSIIVSTQEELDAIHEAAAELAAYLTKDLT